MKDVKDLIDDIFDIEEEEFECPECGKEFDSRKGLKLHASQAHKDIKYTEVRGNTRRVKLISEEDAKDKLDLPNEIEEIGEIKEVDVEL